MARRWPASPRAPGGNAINAPPQVIIHRDGELLAKAVAARLVTRLVDAVAARGHGSVVLTGGGIGTQVLAELAAAPARDAVDWRHLDIWWGDERFLPSGDPERNETGARAALLDHVDVSPERVYPTAPARKRRRRGTRAGCWLPRSPRTTARCRLSTFSCSVSGPRRTSRRCFPACQPCMRSSGRWWRCTGRPSRRRRG